MLVQTFVKFCISIKITWRNLIAPDRYKVGYAATGNVYKICSYWKELHLEITNDLVMKLFTNNNFAMKAIDEEI